MCIDIPGELRDEDFAVELVRAYFADDPATGRARYSGAHFERLGGGGVLPEVAYQITAEDLLAVSRASPAQTLQVLFQADASPRPPSRRRRRRAAANHCEPLF